MIATSAKLRELVTLAEQQCPHHKDGCGGCDVCDAQEEPVLSLARLVLLAIDGLAENDEHNAAWNPKHCPGCKFLAAVEEELEL